MSNYKNYFEVLFHAYCNKCKHYGKCETEEPCNECLEHPINLETSKPVKFEPNKK
jgi:hypothetical protein